MPYDPQRSHRRPRLADDQPAPIDALLDAELPREPEAPPASTNGARAAGETASLSQSPVAPSPTPATTPSSTRTSGRPRLALAAVVVVVLLLAVAWLRRRR